MASQSVTLEHGLIMALPSGVVTLFPAGLFRLLRLRPEPRLRWSRGGTGSGDLRHGGAHRRAEGAADRRHLADGALGVQHEEEEGHARCSPHCSAGSVFQPPFPESSAAALRAPKQGAPKQGVPKEETAM